MLQLSAYVKSAFWRGFIRQALFYAIGLMVIPVVAPVLNRTAHMSRGHGHASWLYLGLFGMAVLLFVNNLIVVLFDRSHQPNRGALLANLLYLNGWMVWFALRVWGVWG